MRCVAWLDATLDPPKRSAANRSNDPEPSITRRQKLHMEGVEFELPALDGESYLLDIFFDVGPFVSSGMGAFPFDHCQLESWQRLMGVGLCPWEVRTLRSLSRAYCRQLALSSDPEVSAPGSAAETPEQEYERRERVASGLGAQLRMLRDTRSGR